ncbi:DNA-binding protein [Streptomonospora sp. PA3]|nr:DNA-binding protein [Streptomonospora sp. PA3]
MWHSRYLYYSNKREAEFAGEHYIVLRQTGTSLRGQSLPHTTGSRLELDLTIDGAVVGGHWSERTSPSGYYRGALYQGTLQMLISPMRSDMAGKWVGFGKNFRINTGEWEIVWVDHASSARKVREYHLRV